MELPPADFESFKDASKLFIYNTLTHENQIVCKKMCKFHPFSTKNPPQPRDNTLVKLCNEFAGDCDGGGYRNRTDMRLLSGVFETPASASSANPPIRLLDHKELT